MRHLEKKGITTLSKDAIDTFITRTYGGTYAYIKTLLDFAIRSARGQALTDKMLAEAFDLYKTGEENEHSDDDDALRVSYHEIGHYLIGYLNGDHPPFVTIVARGSYGGYTAIDAHEGEGNQYTRQKMLNEICCCFGGRAAEYVVYGEDGINMGLASDIVMATSCARWMVCDLGMGKFLYAVEGIGNDNIPKEMLDEIDEILHEQYDRAVKLLTENRDKLDILAKALMEKKSLTGTECEKLIESK
jgi:cell division protease FtsH